jgi:hypothetical protein
MPMDKKDTHSAWFDIAVFAAVVAFFLFSAHSLTKSRNPAGKPKTINDAERLPASLQHEKSTDPMPESIKTIDVGCLGQNRPFSMDPAISILRLVGNWCGKDLPTQASGRHDGTGAEILTFTRPSSKAFTTSYFSIQEGLNKISFHLEYKNGKRQQENLVLIRSSQNK